MATAKERAERCAAWLRARGLVKEAENLNRSAVEGFFSLAGDGPVQPAHITKSLDLAEFGGFAHDELDALRALGQRVLQFEAEGGSVPAPAAAPAPPPKTAPPPAAPKTAPPAPPTAGIQDIARALAEAAELQAPFPDPLPLSDVIAPAAPPDAPPPAKADATEEPRPSQPGAPPAPVSPSAPPGERSSRTSAPAERPSQVGEPRFSQAGEPRLSEPGTDAPAAPPRSAGGVVALVLLTAIVALAAGGFLGVRYAAKLSPPSPSAPPLLADLNLGIAFPPGWRARAPGDGPTDPPGFPEGTAFVYRGDAGTDAELGLFIGVRDRGAELAPPGADPDASLLALARTAEKGVSSALPPDAKYASAGCNVTRMGSQRVGVCTGTAQKQGETLRVGSYLVVGATRAVVVVSVARGAVADPRKDVEPLVAQLTP